MSNVLQWSHWIEQDDATNYTAEIVQRAQPKIHGAGFTYKIQSTIYRKC